MGIVIRGNLFTKMELNSGEQFNAIVIEFLKQKGFHRTLAQMNEELLEESSVNIRDTQIAEPVFLRAGHQLDREYSIFRTWSCASIDIFKEELTFLSFPAFVHW